MQLKDFNPVIGEMENVEISYNEKRYFPGTCWKIRKKNIWAVLGGKESGKDILLKGLCAGLPIPQGKLTAKKVERVSLRDISSADLSGPYGETELYYQARWNSCSSGEGISVNDYLSLRRVYRINPFEIVDKNRTDLPTKPSFKELKNLIIEMFNISGLMDKQLIMLSNGEARKVVLAAALLRKPSILILEEPFSGLDEKFMSSLESYIKQIINLGTTVILSFSRKKDIPEYVSHVIRTDAGVIIYQGTKGDFDNEYAKEYIDIEQTDNQSKISGNKFCQPKGLVIACLTNVKIQYGEKIILHDLSWSIRTGEHWGLMGPNGSGKSTLANLLTVDNPQAYAQDIRLFGSPLMPGRGIWEVKSRMGFFSPELLFYFPKNQTVLETVLSGFFDSVGLFCNPEDRHLKQAAIFLEELGISDLKNQRLSDIHQENKRLCLLARALVKNPQLLILDEPCQGFDENLRSRVWEFIRNNTDFNKTASIYISHDIGELPDWLNRTMEFDESAGIFQAD